MGWDIPSALEAAAVAGAVPKLVLCCAQVPSTCQQAAHTMIFCASAALFCHHIGELFGLPHYNR